MNVMRSYQGYYTRSHQNSEVKRLWAGIVLGWVTSREVPVLHPFCSFFDLCSFYIYFFLICFDMWANNQKSPHGDWWFLIYILRIPRHQERGKKIIKETPTLLLLNSYPLDYWIFYIYPENSMSPRRRKETIKKIKTKNKNKKIRTLLLLKLYIPLFLFYYF